HWGMMTLQALTRHDDVRAVCIEASPVNAAQLRRWLAINGVADRAHVIHAGAWNKAEGEASLSQQSTMGHSVKPGAVAGSGPTISLVTIDGCLDRVPDLAGRRVIIKIDVEGSEPEVIEGARQAIESGRVAAIIWERGTQYDEGERRQAVLDMVRDLEAKGFTHWHFPHEDAAGAMVPWVLGEEYGNVFALAPGLLPQPCYHPPVRRPPPARPLRSLAMREDRRLEHMDRMLAAKAPDAARWAWIKQLEPGADARATAAARHLDGAASVLDLGAGLGRLKVALPKTTTVTAIDMVLWPWVDDAMDLDGGSFPHGQWEATALLAVLGHLHRPEQVLARARDVAGRLVLTYPLTEDVADAKQRRIGGLFNDLDRDGLAAMLSRAGWAIEAEEKIGLETLFACRRL
ncbi:MAG TPA: FkbM family methyltransferase, partial [Candidatus Omnitrophota bacterium]|nr:FkbM family methyltransferase [Candidatus Omnitrophota bacterium]